MKRAIRRLLVSVMLVTVVASLAAPPHAAARSCPDDGAGGTSALVAAMDHGGCEHPGASPCLATVGCLGAPSALQPLAAAQVPTPGLVFIAPIAAPHYVDLCRTGPPTPPPNSI